MNPDQSLEATQILENKKLYDFFSILESDDKKKQGFAEELVKMNKANEIGLSIQNADDVESNSIKLMKLYRDNSNIEGGKIQRIGAYIEVQEVSKGVSVDQIKAELAFFANETFPQKNKEAIEAREKRLAQLNKDFDKLKQDLAKFSNEGEMKNFLSEKKMQLGSLISENYPTNSKFSESGRVTDSNLEDLNKIAQLDSSQSELNFLNSYGNLAILEALNEKKSPANEDSSTLDSAGILARQLTFACIRAGGGALETGAETLSYIIEKSANLAIDMLPKAHSSRQSISNLVPVIIALLSALQVAYSQRPRPCYTSLVNGVCPPLPATTNSISPFTTQAMSTMAAPQSPTTVTPQQMQTYSTSPQPIGMTPTSTLDPKATEALQSTTFIKTPPQTSNASTVNASNASSSYLETWGEFTDGSDATTTAIQTTSFAGMLTSALSWLARMTPTPAPNPETTEALQNTTKALQNTTFIETTALFHASENKQNGPTTTTFKDSNGDLVSTTSTADGKVLSTSTTRQDGTITTTAYDGATTTTTTKKLDGTTTTIQENSQTQTHTITISKPIDTSIAVGSTSASEMGFFSSSAGLDTDPSSSNPGTTSVNTLTVTRDTSNGNATSTITFPENTTPKMRHEITSAVVAFSFSAQSEESTHQDPASSNYSNSDLVTSSNAKPPLTSLAQTLENLLSSSETQPFTPSQDATSSGPATTAAAAPTSSLPGEVGATSSQEPISSAITSTIVLNSDGTTTAIEVNPKTQEKKITTFKESPQESTFATSQEGTSPQVISSTIIKDGTTTTTTANGVEVTSTSTYTTIINNGATTLIDSSGTITITGTDVVTTTTPAPSSTSTGLPTSSTPTPTPTPTTTPTPQDQIASSTLPQVTSAGGVTTITHGPRTTTINLDGSTTTTSQDGSTTTTSQDGSTTTTRPDGTTTTTRPDGTTTTTEKNPDGTTTTTIYRPDGTTTTIQEDSEAQTQTITIVKPIVTSIAVSTTSTSASEMGFSSTQTPTQTPTPTPTNTITDTITVKFDTSKKNQPISTITFPENTTPKMREQITSAIQEHFSSSKREAMPTTSVAQSSAPLQVSSFEERPSLTSLADRLESVMSSSTYQATSELAPASASSSSSLPGEVGVTSSQEPISSAITSTIVLNQDGTTTVTESDPTTQNQRITIFATSPQGSTPQVISSTIIKDGTTTTTTANGVEVTSTSTYTTIINNGATTLIDSSGTITITGTDGVVTTTTPAPSSTSTGLPTSSTPTPTPTPTTTPTPQDQIASSTLPQVTSAGGVTTITQGSKTTTISPTQVITQSPGVTTITDIATGSTTTTRPDGTTIAIQEDSKAQTQTITISKPIDTSTEVATTPEMVASSSSAPDSTPIPTVTNTITVTIDASGIGSTPVPNDGYSSVPNVGSSPITAISSSSRMTDDLKAQITSAIQEHFSSSKREAMPTTSFAQSNDTSQVSLPESPLTSFEARPSITSLATALESLMSSSFQPTPEITQAPSSQQPAPSSLPTAQLSSTASGPDGAVGTSLLAVAQPETTQVQPSSTASGPDGAVGKSSPEVAPPSTAAATVAATASSLQALAEGTTLVAQQAINFLTSYGAFTSQSHLEKMMTTVAQKVDEKLTSNSSENFPTTPAEMAELVTSTYNASLPQESTMDKLDSSEVLNHMTTFAQTVQRNQDTLQAQFTGLTTPAPETATASSQAGVLVFDTTLIAELINNQMSLSAEFSKQTSTPVSQGQKNNLESAPQPSDSQTGLGAGTIAGIAVGSSVGVAIIGFIGFYIQRVLRINRENNEGSRGYNAVPDTAFRNAEVVKKNVDAALGFPGAVLESPTAATAATVATATAAT